MSTLKQLLKQNKTWADNLLKNDAVFFKSLARIHKPHYLWIGCADARVPANQILNLPAGDVFVHRNVANLVVNSDMNFLSVLDLGVHALKIKEIIVCGHYGCFGVRMAHEGKYHGVAEHWVYQIKETKKKYLPRLKKIKSSQQQFDALCELNVIEQVVHVCQTTILQNAWKNKSRLTVHGLIYKISEGVLKDLQISVSSPGAIDLAHQTAIESVFSHYRI